jgi:lipopolysaccharide transport system ATP-binding protein
MPDPVVVRGLGKRFRRYHADRPWTLKEALLRGLLHRVTPADTFWGLRDISFSVARGQMVGVIGRNGAGKSTLLRLIGGIGRPDEGSVVTRGRIGALLDLGAIFQADLTGRENVFVTGVVAGLTRSEVVRRLDAIVAFAELESFLDSPLRTYSTGMQMRLAFAVAAHTDPEVLLIDEALSVGDAAFERKCLERINQFKSQGCTIVFVSHDLASVRQQCDQAVYLQQGRLVAHGPAPEVVSRYQASPYVTEVDSATRAVTPAERPALRVSDGTVLDLNVNRFGSMELQIVDVRLLDEQGSPTASLRSGDALRIEITYEAPRPVTAPNFGATIFRTDGLPCLDTNTEATGFRLPVAHGRGTITLQIHRLDLYGGQYYVEVGAYRSDWAYAYDYHSRAYPLTFAPTGSLDSVLQPPHQWRAGAVEPAEGA